MNETYPSLRLGFVGGFGHHYLAQALRDESLDLEALAVASDGRSPDAARRLVGRLGDVQWFDEPEAMFDQFRPTAVSIGGVYAHNAAITCAALQRGIPVASDKPIAATWDDYHALAAVLRDRPEARLATEFNFRCWACFRAMRQAVRDGRIGRVVLANGQKSYRFGGSRPDFYRRRQDYGSTLLWVASHAIDVVPFVTGLDYTRVAAQHANVARPDYATMEDHAVALFTLSNGGAAVVHADFHQPQASKQHGDDRLRVVGDEGILEVRDRACVLTTHDQPDTDLTPDAEDLPVHRALLDALLHGEQENFSTAQSMRLAAVLLHARDAADTGRAVTIPPP